MLKRIKQEKKFWDNVETPDFGRVELQNLLNLIAGGEVPTTGDGKTLTVGQFIEWRRLIMFAVKNMRDSYERSSGGNTKEYYRPCWRRMEEAGNNIEKLAAAIHYLRISMHYQ